MTAVDWLKETRAPESIYALLGRPLLDPDVAGLKAEGSLCRHDGVHGEPLNPGGLSRVVGDTLRRLAAEPGDEARRDDESAADGDGR